MKRCYLPLILPARLALMLMAVIALCLGTTVLHAETSIAVLDFELKDLTPTPNGAQEIERTASIKPLLEEFLAKTGGYRIVPISAETQEAASEGRGYLFDHHDVAAALGLNAEADWIVVGRVHKPSFLFAYLIAQLVNTRSGELTEKFIVEVKGPQKKITVKGVESLTTSIHDAIGQTSP